MDQNLWPTPDPYEHLRARPNPILPVIAEILAPVTLPASLRDHLAVTEG